MEEAILQDQLTKDLDFPHVLSGLHARNSPSMKVNLTLLFASGLQMELQYFADLMNTPKLYLLTNVVDIGFRKSFDRPKRQ